MPTITLTLAPQDATRLQNTSTVLGYPTVQAMIVALLRQAIQSVEQQKPPPDITITAA